MVLVLTLYVVLFAVVVFAPLRWSLVAYLLLAAVDFPGNRDSVGILNALKGIALPSYMLWRLRGYSGHKTVIVAPVAWILLMIYAALAACWSLFPISALKLVGHMAGSFLICLVFLRASKGGFTKPWIVVPVTVGTLLIALLQYIFEPAWTGEAGRFSGFIPAQAFASFLGALFCLALFARPLQVWLRTLLCVVLGAALLLNGSRIWFIGIIISMVVAFVASNARSWAKICALGLFVVAAAITVAEREDLLEFLDRSASSNRIAAAVTAVFLGDVHSRGLGTLNFRREVSGMALQRIKESSIAELVFGHGTCNGAVITGSLFRGYAGLVDPNRMVHNEWIRVLYEWGFVGFSLWCMFIGSVAAFAYSGVRRDPQGYAKPLLSYLPGFALALAGENFLAGAGSAMSVGFLFLVGIASGSHRTAQERNRQRVENGNVRFRRTELLGSTR
jgi:hypothetical protein